MVSTFTPNINLEEPARGDDVGTWDTPVNNNMTLLDLSVGANTAVGLGSGNVTLSIAQYRSAVLTFNSTLIQNTTVTFPSTFTKPYLVGHVATGSSAFTITLATTVSGGQVVAIPPGEYVGVANDGTNIKFTTGLDRVGAYADFATTSVPAWISACTVPPYLQTVGGTFSSATYPQLAIFLGGTTLPDSRARARIALDAGTNRVTAGVSGISGNTLFAAGGDQNLTSHNHGLTDPGHNHAVTGGIFAFPDASASAGGAGGVETGTVLNSIAISNHVTGITIANAGGGASQNMPPAYVGGITMIRAA